MILGYKTGSACALLALTAVTSGCRNSTEPEPITCGTTTALLCQSSDTAAVFVAVAKDAATRSLSGLKNGGAAAALTIELTALREAMSEGDLGRARNALRRAREALQVAKQRLNEFPGDAPDLTAIDLALLQTQRAIQ